VLGVATISSVRLDGLQELDFLIPGVDGRPLSPEPGHQYRNQNFGIPAYGLLGQSWVPVQGQPTHGLQLLGGLMSRDSWVQHRGLMITLALRTSLLRWSSRSDFGGLPLMIVPLTLLVPRPRTAAGPPSGDVAFTPGLRLCQRLAFPRSASLNSIHAVGIAGGNPSPSDFRGCMGA